MPILEQPAPIWVIGQRDSEAEAILQRELGVPALVAGLLVQRGFRDPADAEKFLNPRLDDFHPANLLPDYRPAADAILGAKERGETVYVHGDYDVDGVTSAAMFTRFLRKIGINVIPHVPHRMKEGYGIHINAVHWAKEHGADLFLTCDCGANAHEQLDAVRELGMRAVVTDHHELGNGVPDAVAVVNPHRDDSTYPYPHLSGVGVVFKLCAGITEELGHRKDVFYRAYLDLAVLGTVADVMPLTGENRIITKFGLENLRNTKKPGLRALLHVSDRAKEDTQLTPRCIGFQLAPRINAVGRIDDAAVALEMLLSEDYDAALDIARRLDTLNTERRLEQGRMFDEAVLAIENEQLGNRNVILVANPAWHPGIIGIVAGKIVETYHRPAFVVAIGKDGVGKGSARSIPGFHLADALTAHRDVILGGGGHELAAGFSLKEENIRKFADGLHEYAGEFLGPDDFAKKVRADLECEAEEGNRDAAKALQAMAPYGQDNPMPTLFCRDMEIVQVTPTSKPEHVRVTLSKNGRLVEAMGFGNGIELSELPHNSHLDVACELSLDYFNGREQFKWIIRDFRLTEPQG